MVSWRPHTAYGRNRVRALYWPANGFPWWLSGKESACQAGDAGLIPGSEKSPGEGNDTPLWYSCLENSVDRGPWRAKVRAVPEELDMT